jgi:hypothetical protein
MARINLRKRGTNKFSRSLAEGVSVSRACLLPRARSRSHRTPIGHLTLLSRRAPLFASVIYIGSFLILATFKDYALSISFRILGYCGVNNTSFIFMDFIFLCKITSLRLSHYVPNSLVRTRCICS